MLVGAVVHSAGSAVRSLSLTSRISRVFDSASAEGSAPASRVGEGERGQAPLARTAAVRAPPGERQPAAAAAHSGQLARL